MGLSDIPPQHAPEWLIPVSTMFVGTGVLFWDIAYVLMTRRSLDDRSYSMPLLALALNIGWEIVYSFYVTDMFLERCACISWLLLDAGLVYTTIQNGPREWKSSNSLVGRHIGLILTLLTVFGVLGHFAFASWFLSRPGIGTGDKTGKWWRGMEGFDLTEMAFWSAGITQLVDSAGSLAMLLVRGNSRGTGYDIWFFRTMGSVSALYICNGLLWWYWPEAHLYFENPCAVFMLVTFLACDLAYLIALRHVKRTEDKVKSSIKSKARKK